MATTQICFISHGGGPLPLLDPQDNREMIETLLQIRDEIRRPKAILVISAHWEEAVPTLIAGEQPGLIYDYSGFPPEAYQIQYPCQGSPELADRVHQALADEGIESVKNRERGFDHGLYVPLKIMFPEADIPCVELSLLRNLDPEQHIRLGEALASLNDPDLLILGSGFSFHNMRAFFSHSSEVEAQQNADFEDWLQETCGDDSLDEAQRRSRLVNWLQQSPAARYNHPREEHLLPLHVCYGAAQSACRKSYRLEILGKQTSMYLW
ncbi:DODA-type extradiol aromatic ring-opening family dioxygenase [Thiomicrorhabdus xiamenensis]|uniref:Dioxygenase n=1 Tax=Thiomicrorhabdus xiamenensis TaxID=2739063 RepID=A0A7D4NR78_9GAMM|nr:class III extradiol ring-cleavage dioxygenase [Thiomicrorhabdus xiamenensis]QKI89330.1 dioxygenase [Thiomicrorhabdus xiamenensis]